MVSGRKCPDVCSQKMNNMGVISLDPDSKAGRICVSNNLANWAPEIYWMGAHMLTYCMQWKGECPLHGLQLFGMQWRSMWVCWWQLVASVAPYWASIDLDWWIARWGSLAYVWEDEEKIKNVLCAVVCYVCKVWVRCEICQAALQWYCRAAWQISHRTDNPKVAWDLVSWRQSRCPCSDPVPYLSASSLHGEIQKAEEWREIWTVWDAESRKQLFTLQWINL